MLSLLLDENISPEVARQIARKRPEIPIVSIHSWQEGRYLSRPDEKILVAAVSEGMTLVTYDQKTILPVLVRWGQSGTDHAGLIFIDDRSIANSNIGAQITSLIAIWDAAHEAPWTNRVYFLTRATS